MAFNARKTVSYPYIHFDRLFLALALSTPLVLFPGPGVRAETVTFTTPGGPYTFTVPSGVTSIHARAVGGGGGSWQLGVVVTRGADVSATLPVSPGETLYVYVAGNGDRGTAGGVNGGGAGGGQFGTGGGGGASDIRTVSGDLDSRILVAGGGGGSMIFHGGGDAGQPASAAESYVPAEPGSSTNGGAAGIGYDAPGTPGTFGNGGTGGGLAVSNAYGGGGGGGWYGGGGGSEYGGGGGGSSFVVPSATNVTNALSNVPSSPFVSITYTPAPSEPPKLGTPLRLENGTFQLSFTHVPGSSFTMRASTDVALPIADWDNLGTPVENPAGVYQFDDTEAGSFLMRFYGITSP